MISKAPTAKAPSLLEFMNCECLDRDLYRGQSQDLQTGQVYGGQVLGQAIKAASDTLEKARDIRSAHAYFLLKGDVNAPIIYEVDRSMDGGSISARRVVAKQHGRQIFYLSASYQSAEEGLDFSPPIEPPVAALKKAQELGNTHPHHFQAKYLDVYYLSDEEVTAPNAIQLWIKTKEALPQEQAEHNSVLAYISDMGLLHSALVPHGLHRKGTPGNRGIIMASIDHAIWFHRPFRADEWFFYDCRATFTGNGRGLSRGSLYCPDGRLFASTMQEGMLRLPRKSKAT